MHRLTLSLLAATLLATAVASNATAAAADTSPPTLDAQAATIDNPYYGPGWDGPVNRAPLPACPAWYGAHTACISEP